LLCSGLVLSTTAVFIREKDHDAVQLLRVDGTTISDISTCGKDSVIHTIQITSIRDGKAPSQV
jgi:hypothetical protein